MQAVDCTLLADGPSDRALVSIIAWIVNENFPGIYINCQYADLRRLKPQPSGLAQRIALALKYYPCRILFVHRDAENQPSAVRYDEVERAVTTAREQGLECRHICVVPIRMTEAWLLTDENAIRQAAGNPHGSNKLDIPPLNRIEEIPDPKEMLHDLLRTASGLRGTRLKKFQTSTVRVAEVTSDFFRLRDLSAYRRFEADIGRVFSEVIS